MPEKSPENKSDMAEAPLWGRRTNSGEMEKASLFGLWVYSKDGMDR